MLRESLARLRAQKPRELLELVLVGPGPDGIAEIESELEGFWGHRVVEGRHFRTTGEALAAGFRMSTAPVVGYVEEHSFPEPGWAEALIEAHRGPWAAVGVGVLNANPESMLSWATLLLAFAPWVEPAVSGEADGLPSHHAHYKREALAAYEGQLEEMLELESMLYRDLRRRGQRLYLEAGARERHVNVSSLRSFLRMLFYGGREFGGARVRDEGFSALQRLLYIPAGPLIVAVKLRRLMREARRIGKDHRLLPRVVPALVLGLSVYHAGESLSYLTGSPGKAAGRLMGIELDRASHLGGADRASW
jgi:hypothetical protein